MSACRDMYCMPSLGRRHCTRETARHELGHRSRKSVHGDHRYQIKLDKKLLHVSHVVSSLSKCVRTRPGCRRMWSIVWKRVGETESENAMRGNESAVSRRARTRVRMRVRLTECFARQVQVTPDQTCGVVAYPNASFVPVAIPPPAPNTAVLSPILIKTGPSLALPYFCRTGSIIVPYAHLVVARPS
jgi:hypothetical protein